jgi:hypothetical protein
MYYIVQYVIQCYLRVYTEHAKNLNHVLTQHKYRSFPNLTALFTDDSIANRYSHVRIHRLLPQPQIIRTMTLTTDYTKLSLPQINMLFTALPSPAYAKEEELITTD